MLDAGIAEIMSLGTSFLTEILLRVFVPTKRESLPVVILSLLESDFEKNPAWDPSMTGPPSLLASSVRSRLVEKGGNPIVQGVGELSSDMINAMNRGRSHEYRASTPSTDPSQLAGVINVFSIIELIKPPHNGIQNIQTACAQANSLMICGHGFKDDCDRVYTTLEKTKSFTFMELAEFVGKCLTTKKNQIHIVLSICFSARSAEIDLNHSDSKNFFGNQILRTSFAYKFGKELSSRTLSALRITGRATAVSHNYLTGHSLALATDTYAQTVSRIRELTDQLRTLSENPQNTPSDGTEGQREKISTELMSAKEIRKRTAGEQKKYVKFIYLFNNGDKSFGNEFSIRILGKYFQHASQEEVLWEE